MTLPRTPEGEGAFLNCQFNGVKCQAFLDTRVEATIITEVLYHCVENPLGSLQLQQKPVLGAHNLPLDDLGEVEVTLLLGGTTAQCKVFVCRGLTQEILVGIVSFGPTNV